MHLRSHSSPHSPALCNQWASIRVVLPQLSGALACRLSTGRVSPLHNALCNQWPSLRMWLPQLLGALACSLPTGHVSPLHNAMCLSSFVQYRKHVTELRGGGGGGGGGTTYTDFLRHKLLPTSYLIRPFYRRY